MNTKELGQQIMLSRKKSGMTQAELADRCGLNIRSVQRLESGSVHPRAYTIRMLNEVLGTDFELTSDNEVIDNEIQVYRMLFNRRKKIRVTTFYSAIIFLVLVGFILIFSPGGEFFGIPKRTWTPFVYIIMFIHLIALGIYWRCPSCNRLLGDVFNIRRCSHCGLKFYD